MRRRQLAAATAAEPHQPLGQLTVPVAVGQVADPTPEPLSLLIGRCPAVVNVNHDVLQRHLLVWHWRFPSLASLSSGDHYHGRLTISRRLTARPGQAYSSIPIALALVLSAGTGILVSWFSEGVND